MTQSSGSEGLDPVAVWGAITGTVALFVQAVGFLSDRPKLRARVDSDFPEFAPNPESDLGGDPGDEYVRLEVTNVGRRPTTLRSAGLEFYVDAVRPGLVQRVLRRVRLRHPKQAGFAFTDRYQWVSQTLSAGQAWVLSMPFERVRDEFSEMTIGAMEVAGLFVETSTGERLRWGRKHIHSESVLSLGVGENQFISPYPDLRA